MSGPILFSGRSDRLIARIKSFLYAWRFIDQVDGLLFVIWPKLPARYAIEDVDYSPFQIFDLIEFYGSGGSDRLQFLECDSRPPAKAIRLDDNDFADSHRSGFDRGLFVGCKRVFSQAGSPQYRFHDEPADAAYLSAGVQRLFRTLPVHPRITRAIDYFYGVAGLEPKSYNAIHVRRGDVYDMLRNELPMGRDGTLAESRLDLLIGHFVARTAPDEFYRSAVEATISRGMRIVFTSDTPAVIDDFRRLFGAKHFIDLSALKLTVPIQKAFADFLVLCNAAHIVGTSSNFSQMPAELGGVSVSNVAGGGSYEIVEQSFRDAFLRDGRVDPTTAANALRKLSRSYEAFQRRVAASIRARTMKIQPAAAEPRAEAVVPAATPHPLLQQSNTTHRNAKERGMPVIRLNRDLSNTESSYLLAKYKNVYSQGGEDGILEEIFRIIGPDSKWCVEFGAWDGVFLSNTCNLIRNHGWSAVLIEADEERSQQIRANYPGNDKVYALSEWVGFNRGVDTIDDLLKRTPIPKNFDLISIDVDGIDHHIWESIVEHRPRVVVIEFNPTVANNVVFIQDRDMNISEGCSLAALIELGRQKRYELVCATNGNGFFVVEEEFPKFNIADNSIHKMRVDRASYIWNCYNGRIYQTMDRLSWWGKHVKLAPDSLQLISEFKHHGMVQGRADSYLTAESKSPGIDLTTSDGIVRELYTLRDREQRVEMTNEEFQERQRAAWAAVKTWAMRHRGWRDVDETAVGDGAVDRGA